MKLLNLIMMLLKEHLTSDTFNRTPEPSLEMNNTNNIDAFHQQGERDGALIPVYHFNALATSRLIPKGGTLLDLGSGTGQYLAYLATCRPDISIIGIELAPNMVAIGNKFLADKGLSNRVKLVLGDMTNFVETINERIDLISSVFSLHHLPSFEALDSCLAELKKLSQLHNSAIWIFDHARPRHKNTPLIFPEIFTPLADKAFKLDSTNSLFAAFSFQELTQTLNNAGFDNIHHDYSKLLNLYQIHWSESKTNSFYNDPGFLKDLPPLSKDAIKNYKSLKRTFSNQP